MIIPVSILFLILTCLSIEGEKEKQLKSIRLLIGFFWIVLVIIATFRPVNMADRENYIDFWNGWDGERFEIGFVSLANVFRTISTNNYWFLFVFASLSIALKLWAIKRMTKLIWSSLLIYIANMFILHDMIQMRCAIASGLLLHAVYYLVNRDIKRYFVIFILATLFHYSSIIFLPLYFLNINKSYKYLYIGLIAISYIIGGVIPISTIIGYIPITGIQNLWDFYKTTEGEQINIFNAMQLGRLAICIFLLLNINKIIAYNKYAILLIKIYAISLSVFVLFSSVPVLAFRISELYQIVEILTIPMIVYGINGNVLLKRTIVMIVGLSFLLMNIFFLEYLK